jgi:hypothetical protein
VLGLAGEREDADAECVGKGKNKARNKAKTKPKSGKSPAASAVPALRKPVGGGLAGALWSSPRHGATGPRTVLIGIRDIQDLDWRGRSLIAIDDATGELLEELREAADDRDFAKRAIAGLLRRHPAIRELIADDPTLADACPESVDVYADEDVADELDRIANAIEDHARDHAEIQAAPGLLDLGVGFAEAAAFYDAARRAHPCTHWDVLELEDALEFEVDGVTWIVHSTPNEPRGMHELVLYASFHDSHEDICKSSDLEQLLGVNWVPLEDLPPHVDDEVSTHGWPASPAGLHPVLFRAVAGERVLPRVGDVACIHALLELLVELQPELEALLVGDRDHVEITRTIAGRPARLRAPHPGSAWLRRRPLRELLPIWVRWCVDRHPSWTERERAMQRELVEAFEYFVWRAHERSPASVRAFMIDHAVSELPIEHADLPSVPKLLADWIHFRDEGPIAEQVVAVRVNADALLWRGGDPACFSDSKRIQLARKAAGISSMDAHACWAFERGWAAALGRSSANDPEADGRSRQQW